MSEFYYLKAKRTGRLKKGGIPDTTNAARGLLEDWNNGKIKYYTVPPEVDESNSHISSEIVTNIAKEFNIEEFASMETEILNNIEKECGTMKNFFVLENSGPVETVEDMEQDEQESELLSENVNVMDHKRKQSKNDTNTAKVDPEMELEGNQKLNQIKKKQFKKEKKERNRRDKVAQQLSAGLENFSLGGDKRNTVKDDYDFKTDFTEK